MKKIRTLFIAMILSFGLVTSPALAYGPFQQGTLPSGAWMNEIGVPITVEIDGAYLPTDVQPVIRYGRTFLPMRVTAESLGAEVYWDNANDRVEITKEDMKIEFYIGRSIYYVNGEPRSASVAPYITEGRTLLPVRDFAESFGAQVYWDGKTASVNIYTGGSVQQTPALPSDIPEDVRWLIDKYYVEPGSNGTGTWYTNKGLRDGFEAIFISELSNGQKTGILIEDSAIIGDLGPLPVVMINTVNVNSTVTGFDMQPASGIYFYGPSIGFQGATTYHFSDLEDNLLLTGTTFTFIDSYYTPYNTVYILLR